MQPAAYYAIVGIGVNVNIRAADLPQISAQATSLMAETGKKASRLAVLCELLARFEHWYLTLSDGETVLEAWRRRLVTLGQALSVRAGEAVFQGVAEDVAVDGSLLLRQQGGNIVSIPAGDVTLRAR